MTLSPRYGLVLCSLGAVAATAAAHSIVIYPGTVAWAGAQLRITLEIDDHTIEHERRGFSPDASRHDVAVAIVRRLEVFTPSGRSLAPVEVRCDAEARVQITFDVPPNARALALRQSPGEPASVLRRQWQLEWTPEGLPSRRLRLTAGGNVEVIRRSPCAAGRHNPFNEPLLTLAVEARDSAVTVPTAAPLEQDTLLGIELDVPCVLLPAWSGLPAMSGTVITAGQLSALETGLTAWVSDHLHFRDANAKRQPIYVSRARLVASDDREIAPDDTAPHGVFTTRVRVTATAAVPANGNETGLVWDGFNAAVQRLPAALWTGGWIRRIADLTASDPEIMIRTSAEGRALFIAARHRSEARAVRIPLHGERAP